MNLPPAIPPPKQALLRRIVDELQQVAGVVAVVLGGSYARGAQRENSDLDIGIYYAETSPFAIAGIQRVANRIAPHSSPLVTDFYEWGHWVNGGAWIETEAGKVDFLYRNLNQVQRTIAEAKQGIVHLDYLQQPPYGFTSVIYLAETQTCLPLSDPHDQVAELKRQVAIYPPQLQHGLIGWLGMAEFSLIHAYTFARSGNIYNTSGCLTRIAALLTQVLFALNETYFISDKGALEAIASFAVAPPDYKHRLSALLAHPGLTPEELTGAVSALHALWQSVVSLTEGRYETRFNLEPLP